MDSVAIARPDHICGEGERHISNGAPIPRYFRDDGLTSRQAQCCAFAAHGYDNKSIAREIGVTAATVKIHLKSAYRVLGIRNRTALVPHFPLKLASLACAPTHPLGPAREQILDLLLRAQTNKEIARHLGCSEATAKNRVKLCVERLGFSNRTHAAAWWYAQRRQGS